MLVCLPLLGFLVIVALARRYGCDWRRSLLVGSIAWGSAILIIVEFLSLPHILTQSGLALSWLTLDMGLIGAFMLLSRRAGTFPLASNQASPNERTGWFERVLLTGVLLTFMTTGLTAIIAPPNHGDVMSYHLPRVVFWLVNRSVAFYPTNDGRQLDQPPGAEYAVLQLHALAGSDRFDNLIQWGGFVLTAVFISLIVADLGGSRLVQLIAVAVWATLPQAITQSTGGKNDCVAACLITAGVACLTAFREKPNLINMLGIGGAFGLALLTKGTSYFYVATMVPAIVLAWPRNVLKEAIKLAPFAIVLVLALNSAHWARNYRLSRSPLGPGALYSARFTNDVITPSIVGAGILKSIAVHLRTPSATVNSAIEQAIVKGASLIGADVNDPRTNWGPIGFSIPSRPTSETYPSDLVQLVLIILTIACLPTLTGRAKVLPLATGLILAFALMSGVLRWQTGLARFHLPWFALWSVAVALVLARVNSRILLSALLAVMFAQGLRWSIGNPRRSLIPGAENSVFTRTREELYFVHSPQLLEPYRQAAAAVRASSCAEVDLASELDMFEYPMLAMLDAHTGQVPIRYYGIVHPSKRFEDRPEELRPCVLICLKCSPEALARYRSRADEATQFGPVNVFISKTANSP